MGFADGITRADPSMFPPFTSLDGITQKVREIGVDMVPQCLSYIIYPTDNILCLEENPWSLRKSAHF